MSKVKIQNYKNININDIIFLEPLSNITKKNNKYISKCKYIENNKNINLFIKTPILKLESIDYDKDLIFNLFFSKEDPLFYDFFYNLEFYLINYVSLNSKKWFDIEFNLNKIKRLYSSNIKLPKNLTNMPIFSINLPINDYNYETKIIDENNNNIKIDKLASNNSNIEMIINLKGFIFEENKFYIDWNIYQIKLYSNIKKENDYLFEDSDSVVEYIYDIIDSEISDNIKFKNL